MREPSTEANRETTCSPSLRPRVTSRRSAVALRVPIVPRHAARDPDIAGLEPVDNRHRFDGDDQSILDSAGIDLNHGRHQRQDTGRRVIDADSREVMSQVLVPLLPVRDRKGDDRHNPAGKHPVTSRRDADAGSHADLHPRAHGVVDRYLDLHASEIGDLEEFLILIDAYAGAERGRSPTSLVGVDGNTVMRREHASVLYLLPSVGETVLLGFQPLGLDRIVVLCGLDLAS